MDLFLIISIVLTFALVCALRRGPPPPDVPVILQTRLAVGPVRSVLAETDHVSHLIHLAALGDGLGLVAAAHAVGRVTVALTPKCGKQV
jgi:hypothetical protein